MLEKKDFNTTKKSSKVIESSEALAKARTFCVYQERYQQEVRDKLYSWGLHKKDVESIIAELISSDFINEERYAKAFAGGKFRIKKWGKVKIRVELKKRNISDYSINKGLQEIDEKDNIKTIKKIILEKVKKSHPIGVPFGEEKTTLILKHKTAKYAISRGFESELVWEMVNELILAKAQ